jgi:hypothetical protein
MSIRSYTDGDRHAVCRLHDRARALELQGCVPSAAIPALNLELASEDGFFTAEKFVAAMGIPRAWRIRLCGSAGDHEASRADCSTMSSRVLVVRLSSCASP